jgi:hypothetical protein
MQELHTAAPARQEAFAAAVAAGDLAAITALAEELSEQLDELDAHVAALGPEVLEQQAAAVKAGAYDSYDLACQLDDIVRFEDPDSAPLRQCLALVQAVAGGSESHTALAIRYDRLAGARWEANTTRTTAKLRRTTRGSLAEKKLLQAAAVLGQEAEEAVEKLYEAFFCRWGLGHVVVLWWCAAASAAAGVLLGLSL